MGISLILGTHLFGPLRVRQGYCDYLLCQSNFEKEQAVLGNSAGSLETQLPNHRVGSGLVLGPFLHFAPSAVRFLLQDSMCKSTPSWQGLGEGHGHACRVHLEMQTLPKTWSNKQVCLIWSHVTLVSIPLEPLPTWVAFFGHALWQPPIPHLCYMHFIPEMLGDTDWDDLSNISTSNQWLASHFLLLVCCTLYVPSAETVGITGKVCSYHQPLKCLLSRHPGNI